MASTGQITAPTFALGILALLVAGCAAPAAGPTGGTGGTAGPTSAASAPPATSGPATAGPTSPPATTAGGLAQVDLTFTETFAFTARGTKGTCKLFTQDGKLNFGFEGTEADYPGLGLSFSLVEFGTVDIKWVKDNDHNWGNDTKTVIQVSSDHRSVTLDQELEQFHAQGAPLPGPEHVKGTITCP